MVVQLIGCPFTTKLRLKHQQKGLQKQASAWTLKCLWVGLNSWQLQQFSLHFDRIGQKKKKILTGISKIARYCCYPPAPTHCRSWWKLTLNISALPWCQVKWKVKHTQEVKFCWKILVQQRRDRRAEGLCWKVSWPFCNLSPVVRFVFLVAGGLSGSEWGVESRCENSK